MTWSADIGYNELHDEISTRLNMKDKFLTYAKKSKIYTSAF